MTPNTKLKTHTAPPARAALPPLLDDSRDWPENGSEAPEPAPDAVKSDAFAVKTETLAGESAAQDLTFTFDVAIVGLGYVGLPSALAIHASGRRVLGLDVSENRLAVIRSQQADLFWTAGERARLQGLAEPCDQLLCRAAAAYTHAAGEGLR